MADFKEGDKVKVEFEGSVLHMFKSFIDVEDKFSNRYTLPNQFLTLLEREKSKLDNQGEIKRTPEENYQDYRNRIKAKDLEIEKLARRIAIIEQSNELSTKVVETLEGQNKTLALAIEAIHNLTEMLEG